MHAAQDKNSASIGTYRKYVVSNGMLPELTGNMEANLGRPVVDQTGLTNNYDYQLDWQPQPGETEPAALKRALLDQLGLELVPANMPIEMLAVEKAN